MQFPDIHVQDKGHCLILGKSGTGKTTLLHLLAGLLPLQTGEIKIDDQWVKSLGASQLDRFRGKKIGIVFQKSIFIEAISVMENLAWAQHLAGNPVDHGRILLLLKRLGVEHQAHRLPYRLSIGEQQRVSIARALVNKPSVILADEPTSALDDQNADAVIRLLEEQADLESAALILVTHDARIKSHFEQQIILAA
ncbi:MAG TPA: ATP-binding cassette domain-containing protein [Saprospiraceae bacterium]|nr:ATP-binding cassette domain-containing protein [Saprospiraceae bacterium]HNT21813.1 ATP-binding cassette domain-containing protein [Saprospiraceae bacterium]